MKQFTAPRSLERMIPICQCRRANQEGTKKFTWAETQASQEISQLLLEAAVKEGGIQKRGAASRTPGERKLMKLLKNQFEEGDSD